MATVSPVDLKTLTTTTDLTGGSKPAPVEEPKTPMQEVLKKDTEESARFAQLARREKMMRAQARQFQADKAAWEAQKSQQSVPAPQEDWKAKLKQDLVGTLTDAGMSYEEVLNAYVNTNPTDTGLRQVMAKLKALEDNQSKTMTAVEGQQQQAYEQALKQIGTEVRQIVKSDLVEYELLNASGPQAQEAVVKLIEQTFNDEGYIMDVYEAAKEVENYLLDQTLAVAKLKKVQSKLSPTQTAANATTPGPVQAAKPANTLSHSMNGNSKPLTQKDRRERAILAYQGKLST